MNDARSSGLRGPHNSEQAGLIASLPKHLQAFDVDEQGCWIAHKRRTNGYAWSTSYGGRDGLKGAAYRILYQLLVGEIPEGLGLDHYVCDNGPGGCCNPFHCRPATIGENVLRGSSFAAVNLAKTHCPRGHEYTPENTIYPNKTEKGKVKKHWRGCRQCQRENLDRFRKANPEKVRAYARKYENTPQGKAKKAERQRRYREKKRLTRSA